jgi:BolA protein
MGASKKSKLNSKVDMIIQSEIEKRLSEQLAPSYLEVINESHKHNVPPGSESHFRVIVVSEKFEGEMLLGRHQMVNGILADLLKEKIHALALVTKTPEQWVKNSDGGKSPPCHG